MVRTTSPRAVGLRHRWKNTQLPRWNTSPGHKAPGRANLGDDEIFEKTLNPNKVKVAKPMQRKSFNSTLVLLEFMNERRQQGPRNQSPVPLSSPPRPLPGSPDSSLLWMSTSVCGRRVCLWLLVVFWFLFWKPTAYGVLGRANTASCESPT